MKGVLYIDNEEIGEADFSVIDKSMGGIGGVLVVYDNYKRYQPVIQQHCEEKGISNISDFEFCILLDGHIFIEPVGGIGVTDSKDFDEIYVEAAGLHYAIIEQIENT